MKALRFNTLHKVPSLRSCKDGFLRGKGVGRSGKTPKKRAAKIKKFGTPTILLVDDKEEVRQVLRSILEGESFVCVEAENGAEALQCLDAQSFALVITDVEMPVMGGLEFLQQLAQKPAGEHPPVIILSGRQNESEKRRVLELGAVAALAKPLNLGELLSAVTSALKPHSRDSEH